MTTYYSKKPSIVRLPPRSGFEILLSRSAQVAVIVVGVITSIFALHAGRFILAPVALAVVVGLMLGPIATLLEKRWRLPSWISSAVVFLIFIFIVCLLTAALIGPLTFWAGELPGIWEQLRAQLAELRGPMNTLRGLQEQLKSFTGESGLAVSVENGSVLQSLALMAPGFFAQLLLFMASLYFFVATRNDIRVAILKLCMTRRLRWRAAHIFRDVEMMVSRYLLSISVINVGLGVAVGLAMWAAGVPSAALWGLLAGLLNLVVYIGPAIMAAILFGVGLASFDSLAGSLMPMLIYLSLNLIEAQFVTPMVIGRTMTLNPFVVLLALGFWIWIWGPIGGFIAIPALLIIYAISRNILPGAAIPELP
ncbi:AI-2E family transporter [Aquamicrobium sp. LC103]|uniref:AI-2E family transporter n=1 Tax=Aquamicrobium sp. LC103 TaxID=1120658 RepID=UPI00063E6F48|nr:AI-2E family transporter [Aquamicrobium sp. LC103]TKT75309.1 AI-2E family transporter [Aquamicrobium sp. LC103]